MFATDLHRGQRDKAGEPYILHPLRVALRVGADRERLAAVLHDVVEDCGVTLDELRERGLDESVVAAIELLTKQDGEDYTAFIERVAQNPIARAVKLADLADNLDPHRLAGCLSKSKSGSARSMSLHAAAARHDASVNAHCRICAAVHHLSPRKAVSTGYLPTAPGDLASRQGRRIPC